MAHLREALMQQIKQWNQAKYVSYVSLTIAIKFWVRRFVS
jgi:hypothetical protein